jgi:Zn ribbon nucleic-acid-binding protein
MTIPIIGGGGEPPAGMSQAKIQINKDDIKPVFCKKCGSAFFQMVYGMGEISGLMVGTKENQLLPVAEFIVCARCGWDISRDPSELMEKSNNTEKNEETLEHTKRNKDKTNSPDNIVEVGEAEEVESNIVEFNSGSPTTDSD